MPESWVKRTGGPHSSVPSFTSGDRMPPKVYGVMAITTMLTFATLTAGYQLLFAHSVFA